MLEILASRSTPPSEVLDALPDGVSTPEIKVPAPNDDPHSFVDLFKAKAKFEGGRLSSIDGLRADWPDGWGLVRASNTTPNLVLRFDAKDAPTLERVQATFREQILARGDSRDSMDLFIAFRGREPDLGALTSQMLQRFVERGDEAGVRALGMRHFDVQLIGGMVLHAGRIAEMKTGEGKTLVGTK